MKSQPPRKDALAPAPKSASPRYTLHELDVPGLLSDTAALWLLGAAFTTVTASDEGEAGAVNHYGAGYGLPRAISGMNSNWLRGYGDYG